MEETRPVTADEPEEEELEGEGGGSKHLAERLLESRVVLLADVITFELARDVVGRLLVLDAEDAKAPISIYINSGGGSVDAGFAIYDMIRFISAPVQCIANGLCASAAVVILLAAAKEARLSLPNSRFMIHQPSGGAHGSVADIKIEADEILRIRKKINKLIAEETGQPEDKVAEDTHRNRWLDAAEAEEYGLVAGIVSSRTDLE